MFSLPTLFNYCHSCSDDRSQDEHERITFPKCNTSIRPGLDMWAKLWPETLTRYRMIPTLRDAIPNYVNECSKSVPESEAHDKRNYERYFNHISFDLHVISEM